MARWDRKFFDSTRGQIVAMLRRAGSTVDELAAELGLTGNGVRAHLATLERDGLVRQGGYARRAGGRKPAHVYELTPEARGLFPKGYEPVLGGLLDVLADRAGPEESVALLKETGGRMAAAAKHEIPSGDIRERLQAVLGVLDDLGGFAEVEEREGAFVVRGYGCPLAALAEEHPGVCGLVEALIAELAEVRVRERCERGENPRCCFEVRPADGVSWE